MLSAPVSNEFIFLRCLLVRTTFTSISAGAGVSVAAAVGEGVNVGVGVGSAVGEAVATGEAVAGGAETEAGETVGITTFDAVLQADNKTAESKNAITRAVLFIAMASKTRIITDMYILTYICNVIKQGRDKNKLFGQAGCLRCSHG